ncbi:Bgt-1527 [Blumeria graminis f. sp. tritici]|uniref:Bgt-1527 n=1 Tax=Blumeria graminis f. sp. tritici TaxID=62690 RepID=A0A9X9MPW5_BLUGR|nr:Bgt-1527 [Blumeria graminis f. sp. tritici]
MNPYAAYATPFPGYPGYYPAYRSATPSPAASPSGGYHGYYQQPPLRPGTARPSTKQHQRHVSSGESWATPQRGAFSPRYNSNGHYATTAANVSRKYSWSAPRHMRSQCFPKPAPFEVVDENEFINVYHEWQEGGHTPPQRSRPTKMCYNFRGHGTDYNYSSQATAFSYDKEELNNTPHQTDNPIRRGHKHSNSTPKRSQTARPAAPPKKPSHTNIATEADARKHRIPQGYSLKHWDPSEEPIMLLGSVFDANSLGKWIYDWTVYHHGPATPITDMAGELWLLLIQLAGKVKRAEECMPRIRTQVNKEMIDDFIESGDRLTDKLKRLLKACETPMLKVGKSNKNASQLGKNAGIEFVDSIFGRDRQLDATERFMSSIRLWNLRFDANCEEILRRPEQ